MNPRIIEVINQSIALKSSLLDDTSLLNQVEEAVALITNTFQKKGKVLFCGNGGSAADAQHLAGEFSGRFYFDRPPLFAEALHVNTSFLTAVANDYSYEEAYARMVMAAGREGDILFALSTSGNSPNVVRSIEVANKLGMQVIGMTGESGGKMLGQCDVHFRIPSTDTPRIQECHMLIGHIICELVEVALFRR
jgi:D-sedoheptulose 7-phosphate isomerase